MGAVLRPLPAAADAAPSVSGRAPAPLVLRGRRGGGAPPPPRRRRAAPAPRAGTGDARAHATSTLALGAAAAAAAGGGVLETEAAEAPPPPPPQQQQQQRPPAGDVADPGGGPTRRLDDRIGGGAVAAGLPRPPAAPRAADGRPLVGRRKPLKINLDLALYRARQVRIAAARTPDARERAAALRRCEDALRGCLAMDPEDGRAYVSLGKLLVAGRRYAEAAALYEEGSAATRGTNAHIWTAWANLAARTGRAALARRLYDAAVVADPAHAAAYHGWGLLEKREGRLEAARDAWLRGVRAAPADPSPYLYNSLAVLAAEAGVHAEARRWFSAGTRTVAGQRSHALWQAWANMEAQLFLAARARRAAGGAASSASDGDDRGGAPAAADADGDPERVRSLFRSGLAVSPRSRYLHLAWAMFEKALGNTREARRLLARGAAANRRDAALLQAWALLEADAGDARAARRLFRRGAAADPGHLPLWQAWGVFEFRAGDLPAAREAFQQGIWAAPPRSADAARAFQPWAVLEAAAGNVGLARELFKCAVKADPRSQPSWLAWAAMEEDLGLTARAAELRAYAMQERQEVVQPTGFSTSPEAGEGGGGGGAAAAAAGPLAPLFAQLQKWIARYDGHDGQ